MTKKPPYIVLFFSKDIPERPSQPGTMAYIAKQEVSLTPRQKVKGPKCGQCEEKKAAVVRASILHSICKCSNSIVCVAQLNKHLKLL